MSLIAAMASAVADKERSTIDRSDAKKAIDIDKVEEGDGDGDNDDLKVNAVVVGSMMNYESSSSDDDEDDDDEEGNESNDDDSSSEDEIEYSSSNTTMKNASVVKPKVRKNANKAKKNDNDAFNVPQESQVQTQPLGSLSLSNTSSPTPSIDNDNSNNGTTDEFGITYQKTTQSYKLRTGPAFENEVDLEKDGDAFLLLSTTTVGADADDDDEFDFDDSASSINLPPPPPSQSTKNTIKSTAASNTRKEEDENEERQRILSSLSHEVKLTQLTNEGSTLLTGTEEDAKMSFLNVTNNYITKNNNNNVGSGSGSGSGVVVESESVNFAGAGLDVVDEDEEGDEEDDEEQPKPTKKAYYIKQSEEDTDKTNSAASEWSLVDKAETQQAQNPVKVVRGVGNQILKPIPTSSGVDGVMNTVATLVNHLKETINTNLTDQTYATNNPIIPTDTSTTKEKGIGGLMKKIGITKNPSLTIPNYEEERDIIFHIANINYDTSNSVHLSVLRTIYGKLLKSHPSSLNGVGEHWKSIGFQGVDPRTDLNRSLGILTPLLLLSLIEANPALVNLVFSQSKGEGEKGYPFMLIAINVTLYTMRTFRSTQAYNRINTTQSVLTGLTDVFAAFLYAFYNMINDGGNGGGINLHAECLNEVKKVSEIGDGCKGVLSKYDDHCKQQLVDTKVGGRIRGGGGGKDVRTKSRVSEKKDGEKMIGYFTDMEDVVNKSKSKGKKAKQGNKNDLNDDDDFSFNDDVMGGGGVGGRAKGYGVT